MILSYVTVIGMSVFFAYLLYLIAEKRGANKKFWLIMGLVFGIFALPFVFFARTEKRR